LYDLGDEDMDRVLAITVISPMAVVRQKKTKRCTSCTLLAPDRRTSKNLKKVSK
jgi:hypothetical protein